MFSIDELLGMIATEAVEDLDKRYIKKMGRRINRRSLLEIDGIRSRRRCGKKNN